MKTLTATATKNKFVKKVKLHKYNKTHKIKTIINNNNNNNQTSNWFGNWTNFFSFK
jgi:hypothetical protein